MKKIELTEADRNQAAKVLSQFYPLLSSFDTFTLTYEKTSSGRKLAIDGKFAANTSDTPATKGTTAAAAD